jgi:hypothetical protein
MSKPASKPSFGARPVATKAPDDIAARVAAADKLTAERAAVQEDGAAAEKGKIKRLTIDLPPALHRAAKRQALDDGISIADAARWFFTEWTSGRIKPVAPKS